MATPDPLITFIIAEQFHFASKMTAQIPRLAASGNPTYAFALDIPDLSIQAMVVAAFSLELYLKCLLQLESKPTKKKHDLKALFLSLDSSTQSKIKAYWHEPSRHTIAYAEQEFRRLDRAVPANDDEWFDLLLEASKEAFIQFRYIYEEGVASNTGWLGDPITFAVRRLILERHPDWARKRITNIVPMITP